MPIAIEPLSRARILDHFARWLQVCPLFNCNNVLTVATVLTATTTIINNRTNLSVIKSYLAKTRIQS